MTTNHRKSHLCTENLSSSKTARNMASAEQARYWLEAAPGDNKSCNQQEDSGTTCVESAAGPSNLPISPIRTYTPATRGRGW